jgi:zinc transport system ATP-binding protein
VETSDTKAIVENQEEILSISNLTVFRSGSKVIEDINLSIVRGEFIGIVGPNGSGKSTLIMTILGILKPKSGSIKIYNQLPNSKKIIGKVGWVPQTESKLPTNVQITVKEFISLGTLNRKSFFILTKKDRKKVEDILKVVGLEEYKDTRITNLSGGQRQRAAIGKALASESDLILMDEPMVGVDRESRNSIMKLLDNLCHEQNKTIIMISHDLASIKQTVHRMIYLEQNIHFDGPTSKFPELSSLAKLRGIKPTHNEDDFWESSESKEEPIIHLVSNSRGED